MAYALSLHTGPAFLLAVGTGRADSVQDMLDAIDAIAVATHEHGARRLLLDLVSVDVQLMPTDHASVGRHAANAFEHLERVASVVSIDTRVGTSEAAARGHERSGGARGGIAAAHVHESQGSLRLDQRPLMAARLSRSARLRVRALPSC